MAAKYLSPVFPIYTTEPNSRKSQFNRYHSCILPSLFPQLKCSTLYGERRISKAISVRSEERRVNGHSSSKRGLGIVDFLQKKNILVTGATGFVSKVVIEKILRTQPQVEKLFLIIKAKDEEAAFHRLKKEIIYSELFVRLRSIHGSGYENFMLKKLIPIVGDISQDKLGIEQDVADKLSQEVDIILNSAANTNLDERYDISLETNTKGPSRLIDFGKSCKRLQVFVQISTAYVNGQRQGRLLENKLQIGDCIAKELKGEEAPSLDILEEFDLCSRALCDVHKSHEQPSDNDITRRMKELGVARAKRHGWQDVYVYSKAMGEMLLDHNRGAMPLAIIRPSVIEGSYGDPFPGWIEGLRMLDPLIPSYGKGQLTSLVGNPEVIDIVPVDMVANAILAAMAKHARKPDLEIYQVGSSVANPINLEEVFRLILEHFSSNPYFDVEGNEIQIEKMKFYDNMEDFNMSFKIAEGRHQRIAPKVKQRIAQIAETYEPYVGYKGRFDNSNTERLFQDLSEEEKTVFGFDVRSIEWKDYFLKIHIPGLCRYVMKGRQSRIMKHNSSPAFV